MDRLLLVPALLLASGALAQPTLYEQAAQAEQDGRSQEAVKLYMQAARTGDGKAASRLADIYDKGIPGVPRDYVESLKWNNAARVLGQRMIGDFPDRKRGY